MSKETDLVVGHGASNVTGAKSIYETFSPGQTCEDCRTKELRILSLRSDLEAAEKRAADAEKNIGVHMETIRTQSQQMAELEENNARLRTAVEVILRHHDVADNGIDAPNDVPLYSAIEMLREVLAATPAESAQRLRDVLKPFAEFADEYVGHARQIPKSGAIYTVNFTGNGAKSITIEAVIAARDFLASLGGATGGEVGK